jgi:transposase
MASKAQLYLMTSLLSFEQFKVIDYDCVEGVGIFLKIEKKEKKVTCPCCGKTTEKVHQNNRYRVNGTPALKAGACVHCLPQSKIYLGENKPYI